MPINPKPAGDRRKAFFIRISGRVQGVGFRYTCYNEARRLGICGWVRNNGNGDVEVWAEGSAEKLECFLRWLRRGPPGARVDSTDCDMRQPTGTYRDFGIER
ncbi:MAG: acylphosphatase [Treponema sp.]|jgi:acylphosphatase|nr:acylphosphatase [Treponema sp.]